MDKKNNKKLKQYKKKYFTGGRVDMSKGGRVKAQRGGRFAKAPEKPKRPDVVQPKEQPVAPTFTQAPTTGKGSDQMFIGREGDVRPAMSVTDARDTGRGYQPPYRPPGTPPYTPPGTPPVTPPTDGTITGTPEQLEAERGKRVIQTGRTAEQIAAGQIPEGIVPTAEVEKVSMEGTEAPTVTLDPTQQAVATMLAQETPEKVAQMRAGVAKTPEQIQAAQMVAVQITDKPDVQAAIGELSPESIAKVNEIRELSGPAVAAQISENIANAAKAENVEGVLSAGAFVPEVTGINAQVSATPDAERQEREAITGEAASGEAAQIIGQVGYEAAKQRAVKGTAAKGAAANMIAETAELPPDIAAAVVEDPATVEAQIDTEPVEVQAAVAALPQEALVSSQIETLLGGMEDGEVPMWAKPAVDAINARMAQRGLSVSTVGRDSLFNAIIQSAMPIAQSNAQALQSRAAQNLSNEQQANLQQATQEQQLRMQNLANRQDAASQTAQMSQQMKTMQSQFTQQAVMATAEQQQQTRMANLQNQQQAAVINAQNQQQMVV